MFKPKYQITNAIVANIKRITEIVGQLNQRRFPHLVLLDMERVAREISSFSSTSIEGNPLPLTDVKRILKHTPAHIRDTEREVLNYNKALQALNSLVDKKSVEIRTDTILNIHKLVMAELLPSVSCGQFRKAPVFVNDPRLRKTIYLPPDHQDVPILTKELISFLNIQNDTIDPLILAGIFHKQFVLIHPFIDGNGRTVRLATKVLLAKLGLDTFHLFSFERYYNANVTKYFNFVGERGNYYELGVDFTPWLEYFTDGIIDELLRVQKELEKNIQSPASGIKEHHRIIIDYIRKHGSISDSIYATLVNRAKPTRALDFRLLTEQGMIMRNAKGRATYYTLKNPD